MIRFFLSPLTGILSLCTLLGLADQSPEDSPSEGRALFATGLEAFEVWIGVPHASVPGLPAGTYQSDNVHKGTPLGLDNDLKNVFQMIEEDGQPVLKITGQIYGGLTTKEEFENYHLSLKFKWGEQKWPPREEIKRDSGILYHCYGEHGRFWQTWKTSLEFQVQESDLGDFIPLGGNTATPPVGAPLVEIRGRLMAREDGSTRKSFDPRSPEYLPSGGYVHASLEPDAPHGAWNHLELYVIGNNAVHVVNGQIVMVVEEARRPDQSPLTKGQIQIQSEAAECYYKEMHIRSLKSFPPFISEAVQWKSAQ